MGRKQRAAGGKWPIWEPLLYIVFNLRDNEVQKPMVVTTVACSKTVDHDHGCWIKTYIFLVNISGFKIKTITSLHATTQCHRQLYISRQSCK